jgi:hypothetical protein
VVTLNMTPRGYQANSLFITTFLASLSNSNSDSEMIGTGGETLGHVQDVALHLKEVWSVIWYHHWP